MDWKPGMKVASIKEIDPDTRRAVQWTAVYICGNGAAAVHFVTAQYVRSVAFFTIGSGVLSTWRVGNPEVMCIIPERLASVIREACGLPEHAFVYPARKE